MSRQSISIVGRNGPRVWTELYYVREPVKIWTKAQFGQSKVSTPSWGVILLFIVGYTFLIYLSKIRGEIDSSFYYFLDKNVIIFNLSF